ncbi:hypothetical protein SAMN02910377_01168 [Pseudobutyrivibrio ruminis]|uniref:Uncharacterized protein n=1 Tax=Pseudobutyrivibrio ruminis TaxID=46206 RepID=A0A1H7HWG9_9FIRM|nr:hypothetical protein [Pseudobutyrivibrio ruminis]SEK54626.1 hypothetical protein SAMN02910377_01168 [Pseudobutyrivibrio ruminis]
METTDILFRTHLNYQIEANSDEEQVRQVTRDEIENIDLHRCTFFDFKTFLTYIRDNYPDYYFSDAAIEAVKPTGFNENEKYDFVSLTDYAKHTAITIGNMTLFNELQKLASAIELLNVKQYDFDPQPPVYEELGSCVVGGANIDAYKLTAYLHESSTKERPIVAVRSYSIGTKTYLLNPDIIDIYSIYKPNATLIETFAYMCYEDYRQHRTSQSFDRLLISGDVDVESMEDMYSTHYDLRVYDRQN